MNLKCSFDAFESKNRCFSSVSSAHVLSTWERGLTSLGAIVTRASVFLRGAEGWRCGEKNAVHALRGLPARKQLATDYNDDKWQRGNCEMKV